MMETQSADQLAQKQCSLCDQQTPAYSVEAAQAQLSHLPKWHLTDDQKRIRKEMVVENFLAGLALFGKIGELAEAADHHPDLHLVGYKNVAIEMWTHTIDGLSENDFILAAKIDQLEG